jgi:hypothetical protein
MGTLNYGTWAVEFDDRLLTHLQIVIVNRLRHGDPLLMSWIDSTTIGDGRSSIWLTNAIPVYFKFSGSRIPAVDEDWIRTLSASAAASTGLLVTDRDGSPLRAGPVGATHQHPQPSAHGIPRR